MVEGTKGPTERTPSPLSVIVVDVEVLKKAILLACRAPSVHNTQPWRWVAEVDPEKSTVHLFVDRRRTVPATDHSGREAILSCGAMLDHLRIAMTAAQYQTSISRFPNPKDPSHLATVEFSPIDHFTEAQRDRVRAMLQRRTDRLPFGAPADWQRFEPVLRSTFNEDVAMLDVLSDDRRPYLVEVSQLSEALRRDDPAYHIELQWWTSSFALTQGMPPSALLSVAERRRVDIAREFPIRSHENRRPEMDADCSKILVLSTPDDTRVDVLRCGEVLSTVLVECTMAGMATCTLTHLIESGESRDIVGGMIGRRGEPQVLIRVGTAPPMESPPAPTPRLPLDSVLKIRQMPEEG